MVRASTIWLSGRTMILKYIDHNRMQFLILCPDSMIDVSRPENSIAGPDLACFTRGAADTYRSLTVNDQEENRMICRVFLNRGMRIKVHCLHLQFSIQQQWHTISAPGKIFELFSGNLPSLKLDRHTVEAGMVARNLGFEIGAETSNLHASPSFVGRGRLIAPTADSSASRDC